MSLPAVCMVTDSIDCFFFVFLAVDVVFFLFHLLLPVLVGSEKWKHKEERSRKEGNGTPCIQYLLKIEQIKQINESNEMGAVFLFPRSQEESFVWTPTCTYRTFQPDGRSLTNIDVIIVWMSDTGCKHNNSLQVKYNQSSFGSNLPPWTIKSCTVRSTWWQGKPHHLSPSFLLLLVPGEHGGPFPTSGEIALVDSVVLY